MTTLEIVLIVVSVTETALSAYLYRKMKKRLDDERRMYEDKRKEYETLIQALPIQRNLL
uniref:Uncharacterized protein n=1 Tax=Stenotrophomonas phage vB_SmaS_QH3 TaxID=3229738 RepID=A0AAU7YTH6_9CAUD